MRLNLIRFINSYGWACCFFFFLRFAVNARGVRRGKNGILTLLGHYSNHIYIQTYCIPENYAIKIILMMWLKVWKIYLIVWSFFNIATQIRFKYYKKEIILVNNFYSSGPMSFIYYVCWPVLEFAYKVQTKSRNIHLPYMLLSQTSSI